MKTFKQISLLCLFWMVGMSTWAYDFAVENADGVMIYYNVLSKNDLTCEVTYDGDGMTNPYNSSKWHEINIPSTVTFGKNVFKVTAIGERAFMNCFYEPNYWNEMEYIEFGLKSITLPNTITSIGYSAFAGCTGIKEIELPSSVTSLGTDIFNGCTMLKSVTLPNGIKSISPGMFVGSSITSMEIPNSVTYIGAYAFQDCKNLENVVIPNSVTQIEYAAFMNCNYEV